MLLCAVVLCMHQTNNRLCPAGPLCRQHDILFLKNSRFAGLKFPEFDHPTTLEAKYRSIMNPDALDFLRCVVPCNPFDRWQHGVLQLKDLKLSKSHVNDALQRD